MSEPTPEPVQAGEPVTIQPADPAPPAPEPVAEPAPAAPDPAPEPTPEPGDENFVEQPDGEMVEDPPAAGPGADAEPEPVAPAEVAQQATVSPATSNESPMLPPNLTSSAGRAHAMLAHAQDAGGSDAPAEDKLGRVLSIVELALNELAKFLPDHVKAPAQVEAQQAVDRL